MVLSDTRGMSVIELMVALAITGVLAAVAIPSYIAYVQQARLVALVLPPLHLIETNVSIHYASSHQLPGAEALPEMVAEIDTTGLEIDLTSGVITLRIDAPESDAKLHILDDAVLIAAPVVGKASLSAWHLSGSLADRLGVAY